MPFSALLPPGVSRRNGIRPILALLALICLAALLVKPGRTSPQLPTEEWVRTFGGVNYELARGVKVDASGNSYVVLTAFNASFSAAEIVTHSYDPAGNLRRERRYSSVGGYAQGLAIALDGAANVYITGISGGDVTYPVLTDTLSYSSTGDFRWAQRATAAPGAQPTPVGLGLDTAGNVYVGGYEAGTNIGFYALSYDSNGGFRWSRSMPHTTDTVAAATAVAVDPT